MRCSIRMRRDKCGRGSSRPHYFWRWQRRFRSRRISLRSRSRSASGGARVAIDFPGAAPAAGSVGASADRAAQTASAPVSTWSPSSHVSRALRTRSGVRRRTHRRKAEASAVGFWPNTESRHDQRAYNRYASGRLTSTTVVSIEGGRIGSIRRFKNEAHRMVSGI